MLKYISTFFNVGHKRSIKAKKNILGMFFLKGISIVISFLVVPITIQYIGAYQYGIWVAISSLVAWLSFFNIGLSDGLKNRFIEAVALHNTKLAKTYVSTTYALLILIIGSVWIVSGVICFFLNWNKILNVQIDKTNELTSIVLIALTNFCFQFILRIVVTLINAMQKPAFASLFDTLTQALNAIIIVILAQCTEGSLLYLALTMCGSSFLVLGIGNSYIFSHELKAYTPDMRFIDFKVTKDILSLSIKFFLLQIIAIAIYQTNNIIITNILGPLEVTIYSIAHKYMSILAMLYSIILAPFWSGFVEARTKDDYAWMRRATSKLRKIFFMFSIFGLLMVLASPVFFRYWLRGSVEIPLIITCLMYIYHIINIWGTLHTQLLAGFGKIKLQLLVSSIAGIMIIPVSIGLARYFGLQGLIIGNILVFLPFGSWFGFVQINKLLHKKAQGIWNE